MSATRPGTSTPRALRAASAPRATSSFVHSSASTSGCSSSARTAASRPGAAVRDAVEPDHRGPVGVEPRQRQRRAQRPRRAARVLLGAPRAVRAQQHGPTAPHDAQVPGDERDRLVDVLVHPVQPVDLAPALHDDDRTVRERAVGRDARRHRPDVHEPVEQPPPGVEQRPDPLRVAVVRLDRDLDAAPVGLVHERLDQGGEVRAAQLGDPDADQPGAAGAQGAGARVGRPVELGDRRQDALDDLRAGVRLAVHHPGDGLHRHAGEGGDVACGGGHGHSVGRTPPLPPARTCAGRDGRAASLRPDTRRTTWSTTTAAATAPRCAPTPHCPPRRRARRAAHARRDARPRRPPRARPRRWAGTAGTATARR